MLNFINSNQTTVMSKTLDLAERLGFVQRIPFKKSGQIISDDSNVFSYLLILDFESTCWKNRHAAPPPEIIEFPVVLLDLSTGDIVSEFQEYVMPTENPKLSEFCTELTGITQDTVEDGIPLGTCLHLFKKWMTDISSQFNLVLDKNEEGKGGRCHVYTCCTWSDWDLNLCLENECRRKQLTKPLQLSTWIDIRAVYKRFYQRIPKGLNGALRDLGLEFEGREHSGIVDARNTARLVFKMVQDGCILKQEETKVEVDLNEQIGAAAPLPAPARRDVFTVSPPRKKKKYYGGAAIYSKENLANVKIQIPK